MREVSAFCLILACALTASAQAAEKKRPLPPPKTPEGFWVGGEVGSKLTSVMLSIRRWPNGKYGFQLAPVFAPSDRRWCAAGGLPASLGVADCAPCDRRLELRASGPTITVRRVGAGWDQPTCDIEQSDDDMPKKPLVLRRADPFGYAVRAYTRETASSDFGAFGGRVLHASLGKDPEKAVAALTSRVVRAYLATGQNTWTLLFDDALDLLGAAHVQLLAKCGGVPGGDTEEPLRCDDRAIDGVVEAVVRAAVEELVTGSEARPEEAASPTK